MNVKFRAIEEEDLEFIRDLRNEDNLRKSCREYRSLNMINQRKWLERISLDDTNIMFMVIADGKPVGVCGLTHINWKDRHTEISHFVENGIECISIEIIRFLKKRCFDEYNLNRLWREIYSFSKSDIELLTKCGFRKEGVMRDTTFWNGKYHDSVIMSILVQEYRKDKIKRRVDMD